MTVNTPFVITIVGAESSGKTSLAVWLTDQFKCQWVPEYARVYLSGLGRPYTQDDLQIIAERQLEIISEHFQDFKPNETNAKAGNYASLSEVNPVMEIITTSMSSSGHIQKEKAEDIRGIIIMDGGMLNLHMWAKLKFGLTIPIVTKALENDLTDLYLLCRPLRDWSPDTMREAPLLSDRAWIYNQYLKELILSRKNFEIIDNPIRKGSR